MTKISHALELDLDRAVRITLAGGRIINRHVNQWSLWADHFDVGMPIKIAISKNRPIEITLYI